MENELDTCPCNMTITSMESIVIQRPFLKWVGGKTQLLDNILGKIPKKMENYREIFLGGGSVLLAVLSMRKEGTIQIKNKVYAYDINEHLINTYKSIQQDREQLYGYISQYVSEYDSIKGNEINRNPQNEQDAITSKESYYYWLRARFNEEESQDVIEKSAIFILLNKLGFRGMYREGPRGMNVPYGHYKTTPEFISLGGLHAIYDLIKDVEFKKCDFTESIKQVTKGDFVYIDPPYAPETSNSFVKYTEKGFDIDMHNELFNNIKNLKKKNSSFILHNACVTMVTDCFKEYTIEEVMARRAINSKHPGSKTKEVIIY